MNKSDVHFYDSFGNSNSLTVFTVAAPVTQDTKKQQGCGILFLWPEGLKINKLWGIMKGRYGDKYMSLE
jgi:hypothetical protein